MRSAASHASECRPRHDPLRVSWPCWWAASNRARTVLVLRSAIGSERRPTTLRRADLRGCRARAWARAARVRTLRIEFIRPADDSEESHTESADGSPQLSLTYIHTTVSHSHTLSTHTVCPLHVTTRGPSLSLSLSLSNDTPANHRPRGPLVIWLGSPFLTLQVSPFGRRMFAPV